MFLQIELSLCNEHLWFIVSCHLIFKPGVSKGRGFRDTVWYIVYSTSITQALNCSQHHIQNSNIMMRVFLLLFWRNFGVDVLKNPNLKQNYFIRIYNLIFVHCFLSNWLIYCSQSEVSASGYILLDILFCSCKKSYPRRWSLSCNACLWDVLPCTMGNVAAIVTCCVDVVPSVRLQPFCWA